MRRLSPTAASPSLPPEAAAAAAAARRQRRQRWRDAPRRRPAAVASYVKTSLKYIYFTGSKCIFLLLFGVKDEAVVPNSCQPLAAARGSGGGSGGSAGAMRLGGVRQLWRPDLNLGSIAVHVAVPSVPEAIGLRVGLLVAIERAALELLC